MKFVALRYCARSAFFVHSIPSLSTATTRLPWKMFCEAYKRLMESTLPIQLDEIFMVDPILQKIFFDYLKECSTVDLILFNYLDFIIVKRKIIFLGFQKISIFQSSTVSNDGIAGVLVEEEDIILVVSVQIKRIK